MPEKKAAQVTTSDELAKLCSTVNSQWEKFKLDKMPISGGRILRESWNPENIINGWSANRKNNRIGIIAGTAFGAAMPAIFAFPVGLIPAAIMVAGSALGLRAQKDPVADYEKIKEFHPIMKQQFQEILEQTRELIALQATQPNAHQLINETIKAFETFLEESMYLTPKQLDKYDPKSFGTPDKFADSTAIQLAVDLRKEMKVAASDPGQYARTLPQKGRGLATNHDRTLGNDVEISPASPEISPSRPNPEPPTVGR